MTRLSIGCFAVLLMMFAGDSACCEAQVARRSPLENFQRDLRRRVARDQASRIALIKHSVRDPKKALEKHQKQNERLLKKASDTDAENLAWLKKHIAKHSFPKVTQIGTRSANEFFLLILHADRDRAFQKKCLESIRQMPDQWDESFVTQLESRSSGPTAPAINQKFPSSSPKIETGRISPPKVDPSPVETKTGE